MNASDITEVVRGFSDIQANCIFFDGAWGIGKTYAIEKSDLNRTRIISLAGISNVEEIYQEILGLFTDIDSKAIGKIVKGVKNVTGADNSTGKLALAIRITDAIISSKYILEKAISKIDCKDAIIVFDDLERMSNKIDPSYFFNVIGFLNSKGIKTVVVGNSDEFSKRLKTYFEKNSEKYIDRIFKIESLPSKMNWKNLDVDEKFIQEFQSQNNIKNLRTIIKANRLWLDLSTRLKKVKGLRAANNFWYMSIRQLCYAIVVEDIEKIKYISDTEKYKKEKGLQDVPEAVIQKENEIVRRVKRYYTNKDFDFTLFQLIHKYYETYVFDEKGFIQAFSDYKESQLTPSFYKDSNQVKKDAEKMIELINSSNDLSGLAKKARDYVALCEMAQLENSEGLKCFDKKLKLLVDTIIKRSDVSVFETYYFDFLVEGYDVLKQRLDRAIAKARITMVEQWIINLGIDETKQINVEFANFLDGYSESEIIKKQIAKYSNYMFNPYVFPINATNDSQYVAHLKVLRILNKINSKKLKDVYDSIVEGDYDAVAKHRCKIVCKELGIN